MSSNTTVCSGGIACFPFGGSCLATDSDNEESDCAEREDGLALEVEAELSGDDTFGIDPPDKSGSGIDPSIGVVDADRGEFDASCDIESSCTLSCYGGFERGNFSSDYALRVTVDVEKVRNKPSCERRFYWVCLNYQRLRPLISINVDY